MITTVVAGLLLMLFIAFLLKGDKHTIQKKRTNLHNRNEWLDITGALVIMLIVAVISYCLFKTAL